MQIDIFSDPVCPWCYIGKRRLSRFLAENPVSDLSIHWRAFQLNPDLPPEGVDRREYMREKFGSDSDIARIEGRVVGVGRGEGLDLAFDRIVRSPNTFDAHRLIKLATASGRGTEAVEALFEAYFVRGEDIGDRGVLTAVAGRTGMDEPSASRFLAGEEGGEQVTRELRRAQMLGISGVPFFIFDGRYGLAGAQEPEAFAQVIERLADEAVGESPPERSGE